MENRDLSLLDPLPISKCLKQNPSLFDIGKCLNEQISIPVKLFTDPNFSLNNKQEFKGPVFYLTPQIIQLLTEAVTDRTLSRLEKEVTTLAIEVMQKPSIGSLIVLQLCLIECPFVLVQIMPEVLKCYPRRSDPRPGHTLLWMLDQCRIKTIDKSFVAIPQGLECWINIWFRFWSQLGPVKDAALDYLQSVVEGIVKLGQVEEPRKIEPAKIHWKDLIDLAVACTTSKYNNDPSKERLYSIWQKLEPELFDSHFICIEGLEQDFSYGIEKIMCTEEVVRLTILECVYKATKMQPTLIASWIENYEDNSVAVLEFLKYSLDCEVIPEMKSLCQTILESKNALSPDQYRQATVYCQTWFRKHKQNNSRSWGYWLFAILQLYFLYYCIVHVACNDEEKHPDSLGCPLEHTILQKWNNYYYRHVHPKWVFMSDQSFQSYQRLHHSVGRSLYLNLPSVKSILENVVILLDQFRKEIGEVWHAAARYVVFMIVPMIHKFVGAVYHWIKEQYGEVLWRNFVDLWNSFMNWNSIVIKRLQATEEYKLFWTSAIGKALALFLQDYCYPIIHYWVVGCSEIVFGLGCLMGIVKECTDVPSQRLQMIINYFWKE